MSQNTVSKDMGYNFNFVSVYCLRKKYIKSDFNSEEEPVKVYQQMSSVMIKSDCLTFPEI